MNLIKSAIKFDEGEIREGMAVKIKREFKTLEWDSKMHAHHSVDGIIRKVMPTKIEIKIYLDCQFKSITLGVNEVYKGEYKIVELVEKEGC